MAPGLPVTRLRSMSTRIRGPLSKLVTVCLVRLAAWPTLRITGAPWGMESLLGLPAGMHGGEVYAVNDQPPERVRRDSARGVASGGEQIGHQVPGRSWTSVRLMPGGPGAGTTGALRLGGSIIRSVFRRSEEHTSELQSLMRI